MTTTTAAISVTEYASRLGRAVRAVGGAVIEGEVQKARTSGSGMLWFSLTDGDSVLSCKVFARERRRIERDPREGDLVQVTVDRPDLFTQAGKLDLIVSDVRLAGDGELLRRRRELIDRLAAEGLCDESRRRPLPAFPRAVGVIAGAGSDGLSDVVRGLRDRWPPVHIVTCAALVQGRRAPTDLVDALARLQQHPSVDVIVVARGGGSVQDLIAFDDERLCRAISACATPVVCAVGHTDNVPVSNHVTWAATTPSRSPELVVPSSAELRARLGVVRTVLDAVSGRLARADERLTVLAGRVDCTAELSVRCERVASELGAGRAALARRMAEAESGALRARGILTLVAHRLPASSSVRALAAALDARALALFTRRAAEIAAPAAALERTGPRISRLQGQAAADGRRVRQGLRRQLEDHRRDYGRATARILSQSRSDAERGLERAQAWVERECTLSSERAERRIAEAGREIRHVGEVIAARDFRRRGWVLAGHPNGAPVRSAAELRPGERLRLELHDGRAHAIVDTSNEQGSDSP
ncbi:MAG: Exodeoxyribonuclease VII large subunit [uncultured Solirubrobacterales bacterium]|uniref:Exodeoxyribonuclease 7 large subunit n=1 Tax=uncultured Solirubrobacterales bacterium TaxID=768556 RepID=A0A6J4SK73_9ACTN|nr:MAG: Exodeoxyribonuclease VII large subunit [uncultured Solirubrobacterales bacterium]